MREWLVGGGLVLSNPDGALLLVRNRRRSGELDWSPPGGVIDDGESLIDGLTREVAEETGVVVSRWRGPVYEVEVTAPGLGWRLRVEAHQAVEHSGGLNVADPDGIVVDAAYVPADACARHLEGCRPWVSEPLAAWLADPLHLGARRFRYHVDGDDPRTAMVSRR